MRVINTGPNPMDYKKECQKCKEMKDIMDYYSIYKRKCIECIGPIKPPKIKKTADEKRLSINKYNRERRLINPALKVKSSLRSRFYTEIKKAKTKKSNKTIAILGCSIEFFINYIESKFQSGMTWENYGKYGWHLDHIKPCCSFDLTNPEEQRKCFHYTNLQPLWAKDNISKGGRIGAMYNNL